MNWLVTDIIRASSAAVLMVFGTVACDTHPATAPVETMTIEPQDFALVPCRIEDLQRPCVLIAAGGKRVLFGTPAGISSAFLDDHLRQLDAVMLFSLQAEDIEGLDEIRNSSWRAGRTRPLQVVGPEGTVIVAEALNRAFEQADALRIVAEGIPPGGYDAAVLKASEPSRGAAGLVYDTGDLQIRVGNGRDSVFEYLVTYDLALKITPCGVSGDDVPVSADRSLACTGDDLTWPLNRTVFLKQGG